MASHPEAASEQYEGMLTHVFPFDEPTLDKLFDTEASKFASALEAAVMKLYKERDEQFGDDILSKIERDIYLQSLDNLWMQHLENMDHLREGIHWISVGQRDPLVEYRRQGQHLFETMQAQLRHEVVRSIFHAQPISEEELQRAVDTELTRAARSSVDNASQILQAENYSETDFVPAKKEQAAKQKVASDRRKERKAERLRKSSAKKRRK